MLSDDFSYPTGNLVTVSQGSWQQTGTTATNPIQVVAPATPATALTFPGYSTTGGNAVAMATSGQDIYRNFSSVVSSGSVYCSFLLRATAATSGDYFLHFTNLPGTASGFYGRMYAKTATGGFNLGAAKTAAAVVYGTRVFSFNTTYLVVLKYTINPGGTNNDSVTYYAFDAVAGAPATEPTTPEITPVGTTASGSDTDSLTSIALRQANSTSSATLQLDALRVTTTFLGAAALPASLLSFEAVARGRSAAISWTTGTEQAVAAFDVERSRDGAAYEPVCRVSARGTGATYRATDAMPVSGRVYYRLKVLDIDGSFHYSTVATVQAAPEASLALRPNPVGGETPFLTHPAAGAAQVLVTDGAGRTVRTATPAPGSTQTFLDLSGLPAGLYQVVYQDGALHQSVRVEKH